MCPHTCTDCIVYVHILAIIINCATIIVFALTRAIWRYRNLANDSHYIDNHGVVEIIA